MADTINEEPAVGTKRIRDEAEDAFADVSEDDDDADRSRRRRKTRPTDDDRTGTSATPMGVSLGEKSLRDVGALSDRNDRHQSRGYRGRGRGGRGGYRRGGGGYRGAPAAAVVMGPEARIRAMLVKVGDDKLNVSEEPSNNFLSQIAGLEMVLGNDVANYGELIRNTMVECSCSFPHKTGIYAMLASLLSRKHVDLGKQLVASIASKVEAALKESNFTRVRLLLRLIGSLSVFGLVETQSFATFVHQLFEFSNEIASKYSTTSNRLVYSLLCVVPWLNSEIMDKVFDEEFRSKLSNYVSNFAASQEEKLSHKLVSDMWDILSQISTGSSIQFKLPAASEASETNPPEHDASAKSCDITLMSVLSQHFANKLNSVATADTANESNPTTEATMEVEEKIEKVEQLFEPITLPAIDISLPDLDNSATSTAQEMALPPLGYVSSSSHGYGSNSKLVLSIIATDMLSTYHPLQPEIVKALIALPVATKSQEPALLAFDVVMHEMLQMVPVHPIAYYQGILVRLCKTLPAKIPIAVEDTMDTLFKKLSLKAFPIHVADRVADWFAMHLVTFGLKWPWVKWEPLAEKPDDHPLSLFIQQVLERTERLSFYERVRDVLQPAWCKKFQQWHNKYPTSAYFENPKPESTKTEENSAAEKEEKKLEPEAAQLGSEVVGLIKSKSSLEKFTEFFQSEKCNNLSISQKMELFVHASLKVGAPSLTHHNKVLDITKPYLIQLIGAAGVSDVSALFTDTCTDEEFEGHGNRVHLLLSKLESFLGPHTSRFSFAVVRLVESSLVDVGAVLGWIMVLHKDDLCAWWPWEICDRLLTGAKATLDRISSNLNEISESRQQLQDVIDKVAAREAENASEAKATQENAESDKKDNDGETEDGKLEPKTETPKVPSELPALRKQEQTMLSTLETLKTEEDSARKFISDVSKSISTFVSKIQDESSQEIVLGRASSFLTLHEL